MTNIIILFTLLLNYSLCHAQNELKTKEDSVAYFENQIECLIKALNYGETKLEASDAQGDVFCKIIRAYYENDGYLCVEIQFLSKEGSRLEFSQDNGYTNRNFCIAAERLIKDCSFDYDSSLLLSLHNNVETNTILRFFIYKRIIGQKPRLIEYLKLTEDQSGQEFIFRNIPIDYNDDK